MKRILLSAIILLLVMPGLAQVGIGINTPQESALLDITSTSKGLLPPRMTTSQKTNIVNPAYGLIVYDIIQDALNVYTPNGWEKLLSPAQATYIAPADISSHTLAAGDKYGAAVSIGTSTYNGGVAMVGAPGGNNSEGFVDVFGFLSSAGRWLKDQTLAPSDLQPNDQFGFAVAVDRLNASTDMMVGAPFSDENGLADAGSVYFYDRTSLVNQVFAPAARQATSAKFGRSVDIAGNSNSSQKGFAIVGAPGANASKGEAYIYEFNPNSSNWEHRATLTDNLGAVADSFGMSVAIHYKADADTGWAFVGAPYDDENGFNNLGSVTAFRKAAGSTLWTRMGKYTITAPVSSNGFFGHALAPLMNCGKIMVSSPYLTGRVYELTLTGMNASSATFDMIFLPNTASNGSSGSLGVGASLSAMPVSNNCNEIYLATATNLGQPLTNSSTSFGYVSLLKFNGSQWSVEERTMIDANQPEKGAGFGRALSINSNNRTILIGAPFQKISPSVAPGKVQVRKF